jgi:hypothetical protein
MALIWSKMSENHISDAVSVETIRKIKYIEIVVTKCALVILTRGFKDSNRALVEFLDHLHPEL